MKIFMKTFIVVLFILISLGGATRAMNAGLACPDWPLCFGQIIPDFQVQVYYEFIHRAFAGLVALMMFGLVIYLFKKNYDKQIKKTALLALAILFTQIIFGGLTVLQLLHFSVVTTHLGLGMIFLCLLLWLYFQLFEEKPNLQFATPKSFHSVLLVVFVMIFIQILIGGLVSSNYAGLACEGFPLCNGELAPSFEGIVGLQVKHRLWGYLTAFAIFSFVQMIWRNRHRNWMNPRILRYGFYLLGLIVLQIVVGAMNVIYKIPPIITVIHLGIAAAILALMLRILYLGKA